MATFEQICDSDEEVFWGPMTAREIELDWRRLIAQRKMMDGADKEEVIVNEQLSSGVNNHPEMNAFACGDEDVDDTKVNFTETESREGPNESLVQGSTIRDTNILSEDADESGLNTSSVKSFISVKGEDRYEVFIPFTSIQQKANSSLEAGTNSCTTSEMTTNADFVDIDLNGNSSGEKNDSHGKSEQGINSSFANAESQESESLDRIVNNGEAAEVALNFNSENIAYIDEENMNMIVDFQVVPTNSISTDIIDEGLIASGVDDSLKIDSHGETSYDTRNTIIDSEKAAALIVEDIKMKVESMNLNSSCSHDEELSNNKQCGSDEISSICASQKTTPDSISEVTSTSIEEKNTERQTDSSDLSFVSLSEEKENNGGEEMETYTPPDKKQKYDEKSRQVKNEATISNRPPKSKIPLLGSTKIPILKPSKLNVLSNDCPWASEFKMKKVPKPKKPEYVVSPAKLGSLLKFHSVKLTASQSTGNLYQRPTSSPLQTNNHLYNTPLPNVKPATATLKTPTSQKILKMKADSSSLLKTPPKNLKYRDIASPVAEYIKCSKSTIIRNVTPSKSIGELPKQTQVNKVPEDRPESKLMQLPSVYYSNANRVLLSPKAKPSSPVLPKLGEKQASVLITPKPQVFRHIGRVKSEGKNIGEQVMPRPIRRTSLHERSYAHLPYQANEGLDVSVLEKQ